MNDWIKYDSYHMRKESLSFNGHWFLAKCKIDEDYKYALYANGHGYRVEVSAEPVEVFDSSHDAFIYVKMVEDNHLSSSVGDNHLSSGDSQ